MLHFVFGASPQRFLCHFPNKIASFPQQFASFPQQLESLTQQLVSLLQQQSSSWRKNYKTMVELEEVEKEIDARRMKEEKKAIGAIKRNPKYFYTYAKTFSKIKGEMAAFEKENGELTDDPFEKSEILRNQKFSSRSKAGGLGRQSEVKLVRNCVRNTARVGARSHPVSDLHI